MSESSSPTTSNASFMQTGGSPLKLLNSSGNNNSWKCACTSKLLTQIAVLWKKKQNSGDFVMLNLDDPKWSELFTGFILNQENCTAAECTAHADDMLWYVPSVRVQNAVYVGTGTSHLQVFRRQSRNKPYPGDHHINWEETVCLNVILQQLDYFVTCAVCTKTSPHNLQILRKNCQRVHPSPSRRRMDAKGECEEITYPKIYFAIDNFEQVFSDVIVTEGECVCVELVARDRYRDRQAVIFLGSIRYDVLKKLYDSRGSTTWNWAQKIMSSERRRHEFVKMRGPHGKGFAEMAVARVASCGFETPMSEGGYDMSMSLDAEYASTRRMSDTNLFNRWTNSLSRRPVMTPGPQPCATPTFQPAARNRRWQSDSDNVNQDSDLEVRSVTGAPASSTGSTWSMKGIGSALKWLSDKKESTPLNAYLTYVTLPWASILEDLLSPSARKPILTFDLDFLDHQS